MNELTAFQLNKILNGNEQLPNWLIYGQTVLYQKDWIKGNAVENYLLIFCLPLMWKLLTGIISKNLYSFLEEEMILSEEQKGCKRNSTGTKDQVLSGKAVETAKGKAETLQ